MSRWLVTRPCADAQILAETLGTMGHTSIISPVIHVLQLPFRPIDWSTYDAIIFTSSNAVRLGGKFPKYALSLPVLTVGIKTAEAAKGAGFTSVSSADGNVQTLARHLARRSQGPPSRYLHICGQQTKGDLHGALGAAGRNVETVAVYQVEPAARLTDEAVQELRAGTLDGVILLSPKTARVFAQLASHANIDAMVEDIVFAVISEATATELGGFGGNIKVASHPDLEHVLALLH